MTHPARCALAAMAVLLACGPAPAEPARAERAEPARWKIKVGERLRYTVARASSTSFGPGGEIKLTVVADFTWDVTAVGADGTADVTASLRRVRWEKNGVVPAYDSAKPKPEGDDLAPVIVGREARFRLTPGGRVTDFAVVVPEDKLPDSTRAALADGRRDPMFVGLAPTAATMFYESEDALRTLVDETAVPLPDAPLEPGAEPWRDADGRPGGLLGIRLDDLEYRLPDADANADANAGGVARAWKRATPPSREKTSWRFTSKESRSPRRAPRHNPRRTGHPALRTSSSREPSASTWPPGGSSGRRRR